MVRYRGPVHLGWFVSGPPVHFVSGQELQVHAGVAGGLHIGALRAGPVFVVAHGEEYLVVEELSAVPVGVHAADVTDVVAVLLQETHHRVLVAEVEIAAAPVRPWWRKGRL